MYTIGIDLGGTNIAAGVVDGDGKIVATASCKTNIPRPVVEIIDDMAAMCHEALKKANLSLTDIHHIGAGCPGSCNTELGIVEYSNNLGFAKTEVASMLTERLHLPVYIENDANAAALGEARAGAAKGAKSCVCITLGTGVGGGVIDNGTILRGFNYNGGELGHTVIVMDGEPCSCGRNGCWESYASATALIRQTRAAMIAHPESVMWKLVSNIDDVNGRTAFDGMRAGDEVATAVVQKYEEYLACGLANIINIFQPEVLCIGGGVSKEGETLLAPIRALIERERYSKNTTLQTRICVATLGNNAGIIGAAFLGR